MPKLLQINTSVNRGSTGKITEQIGSLAIANGWDSYVAYGNYNIGSKSKTYKIRGILDLKIHQIKSFLWDKHGLASTNATLRLISYISRIEPDIIHLQNIHGYYLNYEVLFRFLKRYGKPVVWTLHDCWAFTGHCTYFTNPQCDKWKVHCHKCPRLSTYPASIWVDRSYKNYTLKKELFTNLDNLTIVPVSYWLDSLLDSSFLRFKRRIVIHNGIDLHNFHIINNNKSSSFRIIGVANRWDSRKGLQDFIKLRGLLPNEYQILLVGLSSSQIKKLPKGIIGITRTENQQALAKLYAESNVFVNPTYEDNFPTTNIEALASGIPVITYDTGGSPEAIESDTGIVIPVGEVSLLADAIVKIKNNPVSQKLCRKRALNNYDKDTCFYKYIDLYNSLLKYDKDFYNNSYF